MKKIFLLLLLAINILSFAQQTTYTKTFDWVDDIIPMNMLIQDDYLYIPLLVYNNGEIGRSIIYKLNEEGSIVDSIELSDGLYQWIYEILPNGNEELFAFGSSWEGENGPVKDKVYVLSTNLEALEEQSYSTDYGGFNRMHGFVKNNGNMTIIGDISHPDYDIRIVEFSQNLDKMGDTIYIRPYGQIVWGADYNPYNNAYYLYTIADFDPDNDNPFQFNIIDSSYALQFSSGLIDPVIFGSHGSIKIIDSNSFYHAGSVTVFDYPNNLYDAYGIYKFNNNYDVLDSVIIDYNNDTICNIAFYNGFDFANPNQLYFLGTKNYSYSDDSYMELISLDSNFNINWRKYFGGDQNYMSNEVKALEEGGCMISAVYKNENGERKTILMKIDENGLITSTNEETAIPILNAIISPNPGNEFLQLQTGIYPARLQLFNINGQLVLEEDIQESATIINTSNLTSGTYVWQLLKDRDVVENGKWVKE
jgi:hypothetical protein